MKGYPRPPLTLARLQRLGRLSQRRATAPTLWVIAPPKSGSTWLSLMLCWLMNWETTTICPPGWRREQEVTLHNAFLSYNGPIFMPHNHCKASESTINVIKRFNIKVILLSRNIFDTVISIDDHLMNDGVHLPIGYVPTLYKTWSDNDRLDFIIDLIVPWYSHFYTSWAYAQQMDGVTPLYVDYADLKLNTPRILHQCVGHVGQSRTGLQIENAIQLSKRTHTRFNKGVTGRGETGLTPGQKDRINTIIWRQRDPILVPFLERIMQTKIQISVVSQVEQTTDIPISSLSSTKPPVNEDEGEQEQQSS
jgi:hypothetical protein